MLGLDDDLPAKVRQSGLSPQPHDRSCQKVAVHQLPRICWQTRCSRPLCRASHRGDWGGREERSLPSFRPIGRYFGRHKGRSPIVAQDQANPATLHGSVVSYLILIPAWTQRRVPLSTANDSSGNNKEAARHGGLLVQSPPRPYVKFELFISHFNCLGSSREQLCSRTTPLTSRTGNSWLTL